MEVLWESENGLWQIIRINNVLGVSDGWLVDWTVRYDNGNIAYDGRLNIPKYVRKQLERVYKELENV